jgi:hypothetical protein
MDNIRKEEVFGPGEKVTQSGTYRCDGRSDSCPHQADVRGQRFPPLPQDCRGTGWVLEQSGMANPNPT